MNFIDETKYFYDITPVMDMQNFVMLLLADLANKSPVFSQNIACLPVDYKQRMQEIMYEENGWGIRFSKLIPIEIYYENQKEYEQKLGLALQEALRQLGKETDYDFVSDCLKISFTQGEIEQIKNRYDPETLEIMDHFSNLLQDYSFSRNARLEQKMGNRFQQKAQENYRHSLILSLRSRGIKYPEKYLSQ